MLFASLVSDDFATDDIGLIVYYSTSAMSVFFKHRCPHLIVYTVYYKYLCLTYIWTNNQIKRTRMRVCLLCFLTLTSAVTAVIISYDTV